MEIKVEPFSESQEKLTQTNSQTEQSDGTVTWLFFSALFFITSIIFFIIGFVNLANIQDAEELVGGDAYNYIIHSIKSNGYLLISLINAIFSIITVAYAIFIRLGKLLTKLSNNQ